MAEVEVEPIPEDIVASALGKLTKTVDGAGYAFSSLAFPPGKVSSLHGIDKYQHVRSIDLAENKVEELQPLTLLPYLLELSVKANAISGLSSLGGGELKYLHTLTLSKNKIAELSGFVLPQLKTADFSENEITTLDLAGAPELESLNLDKNQLAELNLQGLKKLKTASVQENQITTLALAGLPALESLKLDNNALSTTEAAWGETPALKELSLSQNVIHEPAAWASLTNLPTLRTINFLNQKDLPEGVVNEPLLEILIVNPRVKHFEGDEGLVEVTPELLEKATELQKEREAKALEEQAAAEAAAAAAEGEAEAEA